MISVDKIDVVAVFTPFMRKGEIVIRVSMLTKALYYILEKFYQKLVKLP